MREFLEGVSLMHLQRMTGFKQLMFEPEGGVPPPTSLPLCGCDEESLSVVQWYAVSGVCTDIEL